MRRVSQAVWLLSIALSLPATVLAQGVIDVEREQMSDERARAHFDVGRTLYDAGRFKEAAEEWEKAHALSGRSELLYNIYVAYRDASNTAQAVSALERYLASDAVPADQRINLEARLEALREAQRAEATPTAAPAAEPMPAAEPAAAPAPAPSEPEPPPEPSIVPYVLVGVGGALVVGGVVTGIVASGKVSDLEKSCPDDRCPPGFALDEERSDARLFATLTDVLLVGGVVVAGVGAGLLLFGGDGEEASASSPRAALACMPGGCFASVTGSLD